MKHSFLEQKRKIHINDFVKGAQKRRKNYLDPLFYKSSAFQSKMN